uniref:NET domain-containing protein n=1 Tax=Meloidogyne hapla TaxID=6305 RepID=A0A1I8BTP0_MELHA
MVKIKLLGLSKEDKIKKLTAEYGKSIPCKAAIADKVNYEFDMKVTYERAVQRFLKSDNGKKYKHVSTKILEGSRSNSNGDVTNVTQTNQQSSVDTFINRSKNAGRTGYNDIAYDHNPVVSDNESTTNDYAKKEIDEMIAEYLALNQENETMDTDTTKNEEKDICDDAYFDDLELGEITKLPQA